MLKSQRHLYSIIGLIFSIPDKSDKNFDAFKCDVSVHCEPGFYSSDNSTCTACPIGTFKNQSGNDACSPCHKDFTTDNIARTEESECFVGESILKFYNSFVRQNEIGLLITLVNLA